jgi:uncharacterized protein (DUF697 family)
MAKSKAERARVWVDGFAISGAALVIAAVFPGATSLALVTIEGTMCYQIGKIYKGDDYTMGEAVATAGVVGLAAVLGKIAALEALNLVPLAGWAVKGPVAGAVIKGLGEAIIYHFERAED